MIYLFDVFWKSLYLFSTSHISTNTFTNALCDLRSRDYRNSDATVIAITKFYERKSIHEKLHFDASLSRRSERFFFFFSRLGSSRANAIEHL